MQEQYVYDHELAEIEALCLGEAGAFYPDDTHEARTSIGGPDDELALLMGVDTSLGLDEMGVDSSLGDDDMGYDSLSGRRPRPAARGQRHSGQIPSHPVTADGKPVYMQVFAFPPTAILTAATVNVQDRVERKFRCERLTIGSRSARFFLINNLTIGRETMWVNAQGAPGEGFSEAAFGVSLYGYVADVANNIILNVTNSDPGTQTFTGFIRGPSVP